MSDTERVNGWRTTSPANSPDRDPPKRRLHERNPTDADARGPFASVAQTIDQNGIDVRLSR
jgi:hypothetical protein